MAVVIAFLSPRTDFGYASWAPARGGERIGAGSRPVGLGLRFGFHRLAQPDGRGVRAHYA